MDDCFIDDDARTVLATPPPPLEDADRARLFPLLVHRLTMGTVPRDVEVVIAGHGTLVVRHEGRAYQLCLARAAEHDRAR